MGHGLLTALVGLNNIWFETDTDVQTINLRDLDLQLKALTNAAYVDFYTSFAGAMQEGRMAWDAEAGTVRIGMPGGNVELLLGQEQYLANRPKNKQGVQIDNGEAVYLSGASGAIPEVKLANASLYSTACKTIALATENISSNQRGYYTTFGIVKDIKTDYSGWTDGTELWLDNTDGGLTHNRPSPPICPVRIGYVMRSHGTEGSIFVTIDIERDLLVREITKEPTGFTDPEDVIVSYDSSARTVTLTGTVNGYYRGEPVLDLITSWESDAHPDVAEDYFLVYNGTDFEWILASSFDFSFLLIAYISYGVSDKFALRECHGLMQWQSHEQDHDTIGTYKRSGGTLADYVISSNTPADRRPSVATTNIKDEDLVTANPSLAANGPYTQFTLSSASTPNFDTAALDIVPLSTNRPYWNEFTGGVWQQTLISNNYYMSIWLAAIPCAADSDSQKYRYIWVQGQNQSLTLSGQEGLIVQSISLGAFNLAIPEIIFISQIIIRYQGGNWELATDPISLLGTKQSQTSSPQGNALEVVEHDATLSGDGTVSSPLSVVASGLGHVDGYVVKYSDTDTIAITSGSIEANGEVYILSSDTTHDMTSLASAFDHHYIYIDDDASTAPVAVIIDSTTEPAWSDSKNGYYNGDDRCIGVITSINGASTIIMFISIEISNNLISTQLPMRKVEMASDLTADNTWQTPDVADGDIVTPVNAVNIRLAASGVDTNSTLSIYVSAKEMADIETSPTNAQYENICYNANLVTLNLNLGTSRQVRVAGASDDENLIDLRCAGYNYKR